MLPLPLHILLQLFSHEIWFPEFISLLSFIILYSSYISQIYLVFVIYTNITVNAMVFWCIFFIL